MKPLQSIALLAAIFLLHGCHHHDHHHHHDHEPVHFQYTAYTDDFEVFVEADPFVAGRESEVLVHITTLPSFKPLDSGEVIFFLRSGGSGVRAEASDVSAPGIYLFSILPPRVGVADMAIEIHIDGEINHITLGPATVYSTHDEGEASAGSAMVTHPNAVSFTKEQSWKVDFATGFPEERPFGGVIRTMARVSVVPDGEVVVVSTVSGVVLMSPGAGTVGAEVRAGQELVTISGEGFLTDNILVEYRRALSDLERARADHTRLEELSKDRLVTERDLLEARQRLSHAEAVYRNVSSNVTEGGRVIRASRGGFIREWRVGNGTFVEAGQPLGVISRSDDLLLTAEVPQRHIHDLPQLSGANIRSGDGGTLYPLEQLNGRILSFGRSTVSGGHLIPVHLHVRNPGHWVPGSLVEVFLKTAAGSSTLTVPNSALIEQQGLYFVYVQLTPELFEKREVHRGVSDGLHTEIVKGLAGTDRIVIRGARIVKLAEASSALDAHSGHVH